MSLFVQHSGYIIIYMSLNIHYAVTVSVAILRISLCTNFVKLHICIPCVTNLGTMLSTLPLSSL